MMLVRWKEFFMVWFKLWSWRRIKERMMVN